MVQDVLKILVVEVLLFKINVLLIDLIIDHVHGMVHAKIKHVIMQEMNMLVMINVQLTQLNVLEKLIMLQDVEIEVVTMLQLLLLQILDVKIILQRKIALPKKMVDVLLILLVQQFNWKMLVVKMLKAMPVIGIV